MRRGGAVLAGAIVLACAPALAGSAPRHVTIEGSRVFPESIAADSAGNLYASSLDGVIYRARAGSDEAVAWIRPDAANKLLWTMGVLPDERSHTLWVCSTPAAFLDPPRTGDAAVVAFDLETGAFKARYILPKPSGEKEPPSAVCNDIAVSPSGAVYVTETAGGRLFSIAPGTKAVALEAQDRRLIGVEGPAFTADGTLYLNNTRQNTLLRVDRTAGGAFAGLTPIATSIPLDGPDGLRPYKGNTLLQAETGGEGRAELVTITGDTARIDVIARGTGSAGIAHIGNLVYTAAGKVGYLFDPKLKGQDPGAFSIEATRIGAKK